MNELQAAREVLRLARKRGLKLTVERPENGNPILHVSPKHLVSPYVRLAIPRHKANIITLLDNEGHASCTAHDGMTWTQVLARCLKCDACDWGIIGQVDDNGTPVDVWGCLTCHCDAKVLEQQIEDRNIAQHVQSKAQKKKAK